jgi:hypothetical protein
MERFSVAWTNQVKIDPEDILFLVEEMGRLHDEGCEPSWFTQIGILSELFPDHTDEPYCIMERMQCLIKVMGKTVCAGGLCKRSTQVARLPTELYSRRQRRSHLGETTITVGLMLTNSLQ